MSAIDPGEYTAMFTPNNNHCWPDGTISVLEIPSYESGYELQYPLYQNGIDTIRFAHNDIETPVYWWTRSTYIPSGKTTGLGKSWGINSSGSLSSKWENSNLGYSPCMRIGEGTKSNLGLYGYGTSWTPPDYLL